ncbi:S-adenosyl-L-methionine-dependent methyltransferase [Aspergillus lucknowensis]|uniref:S-adenosyl-L-methionine-dependent methyltransferase n=1 Tax=Aspergillus lucknowensis TaxID=176173 RepID=A0ABR4LHI0_9EURO
MALADEILSLTQQVRSAREPIDDDTRAKAIKAARGLLEALVPPPETVIQDVVLNPVVLMALRLGVQIGVFRIIRDHQAGQATTQEIAEQSGASPVLLDQILRLLAATGYVLETGVQTYGPSALTETMASPVIEGTTRACFDIGNFCTTYAPEYFRRNGNQFPTSALDTPFQLAKNTQLSYFAWLDENASLAKDFQQWMTAKLEASPNWVDWFDVEGVILDGLRTVQPDDADGNVLLVDVGGGDGHYVHAFNRKFPNVGGRRIVQDLPHVVSNIADVPESTELMAYDFFEPQPVKGARAYYLHWILHDWDDKPARDILTNIAAAMEPGYSRLIINEQIVPDRGCDFATACLGIMMMVQVGALERSEQQWRALLTSVGFTDISFHQPPGNGEGIIVVKKS